MRPVDAVTVTTCVRTDPATAFRLFTEDVDVWWRRGPAYRFGGDRTGAMRFEPFVGGRFLEEFPDDAGGVFEVGRILVWEPGARLVFGWRGRDFAPGETTEVEVRFEAEGAGTRVTVVHRGWDRLPATHPAKQGLTGPAFTGLVGLRWADHLRAFGACAGVTGGTDDAAP